MAGYNFSDWEQRIKATDMLCSYAIAGPDLTARRTLELLSPPLLLQRVQLRRRRMRPIYRLMPLLSLIGIDQRAIGK